MRLYTRGGDAGMTALRGGQRVSKASARVSACGELDELGAVLGVARSATALDDELEALIRRVQTQLSRLAADLSAGPGVAHRGKVGQTEIDGIEEWIDRLDGELPALEGFVLPGGTQGSSLLHQARTVCRRAERSAVALAESEPVDPLALAYLNRLSDLLFCLARAANHRAGIEDDVAGT
jgi:cob(I)alamin adenosyltransferase